METEPESKCACEFCGREFTSERGLSVHVGTRHKDLLGDECRAVEADGVRCTNPRAQTSSHRRALMCLAHQSPLKRNPKLRATAAATTDEEFLAEHGELLYEATRQYALDPIYLTLMVEAVNRTEARVAATDENRQQRQWKRESLVSRL